MEPNDTILFAELIELDSSSPVVVSSEIGDRQDLGADDVDLYKVNLISGDIITADIDAQTIGSPLNSVLRIFDADGNQLLRNNNTVVEGVTSADSFLKFNVPQEGNFYIGVSSARNFSYNPNVAGSGSGNSSGAYDLILTLEREVEITEPNDTISTAEVIELDALSPVEISRELGDNPNLDANDDVDLFEIELDAGDTILADINAEIKGSSLDSVLSIFNANGDLLVQNDDNSFDDVTESDSFQQFTPLINGTYYIGVSSSENLDYNPNLAGSGRGGSSGTYDLVLTLDKADNGNEIYSEANDTILSANLVEIDSSSPVVFTGEIGDNPALIAANNDVDLFEVALHEGDTLSVNLDAQVFGSELNSVLTIFDANGDLLAQNDDNSFDDVVELDSFLSFIAPEDDTYYVGVSSSENLEYDPTTANSGIGESFGAYRLEITVEDSPFTTPITRFQNGDRPGTYLFAGPEESQGVRDNFPNFIEEGQAFKVATEPRDDLIRLNRFQNQDVPGTYLYAGEEESKSIRANFPNFLEEGIAFYVYDGGAGIGEDFYRFQNQDVPGTYLFVAGEERLNILANFPNFVEEGIAFEVEI